MSYDQENLEKLIQELRAAWWLDTSAIPEEWSSENPSRGQCAVTALVVQDIIGGDLLRTTVGGESHYYNRLPDGSTVDLTLDQFGGRPHDAPGQLRTRQYVLGFPATRKRYAQLLSRMWA